MPPLRDPRYPDAPDFVGVQHMDSRHAIPLDQRCPGFKATQGPDGWRCGGCGVPMPHGPKVHPCDTTGCRFIPDDGETTCPVCKVVPMVDIVTPDMLP